MLLKREQFAISIRKQNREEIFQKKRQISLLQQEKESEVQNLYTAQELAQYIYQSYLEQDYTQLSKTLQSFNSYFVSKINVNANLNEFLQTDYFLLFFELAKMKDVEQEVNPSSIRLECLIQTLAILTNYTYLSGGGIVVLFLQNNLQTILLDDILSRIYIKEKLYFNFERWSRVFENVCQTLSNMLIDKELTQESLISLKNQIIDSILIKIWKNIYLKNGTSKSWPVVIQLERILLSKPIYENISSTNTMKILQQCTFAIARLDLDDKLYQEFIELLFQLSEYQMSTTLTLTKSVWEQIIKKDTCPNQICVFFINMTSINCENFQTEQYLIDIGLIEKMKNWLNNPNDSIISKIFKCFNNLLFYNNRRLVNCCFDCMIPFIHQRIALNQQLDEQTIIEYFHLLRIMLKQQQLNEYYFRLLIKDLELIKHITFILLEGKASFKELSTFFVALDIIPKEFKHQILCDITQFQFVEIINKLVTNIDVDDVDDGSIQTIFDLLYVWESDVSHMDENQDSFIEYSDL